MRLSSLIRLAALVTLAAATFTHAADAQSPSPARKIPVILDTDIGDDIDDTWALGLLLESPELDLKLAVGDYGRPQYRARLLAKLLEKAGRTDVPIGIGIEVKEVGGQEAQAKWVGDYDLKKYPGKVHEDGVKALIDTIMKSREPITLICIGPVPNIAEALEREPGIARKARFVGMHGSVRKGYGGSNKPDAEWNVKAAPKACQKVFTAAWDMTITPLDTCGVVTLDGERYARVRDSKRPIAGAIIENYRVWSNRGGMDPKAPDSHSSTLFDCVAIYLAISHDLCRMEQLGIRVTDDGFTRLDEGAKKMSVATEWKSLDGFRDWMTNRLTAAADRKP